MSANLNQLSKRILIADDDPVIRHLVTSIVTREGYSVIVATDGDEAYRILQRDADFRVAIFDMMMPGLKGLDILRYMRTEKRLLRIPVMIITSERDLSLMTTLMTAGANAVLPKPFSTLQIQTMLHTLIGQQQRNAEQLSRKLMTETRKRVGV